MLKLRLTPLPASIMGIYGPERDVLPERMRYLHPDAAASYMAMEAGPHRLRVSDMWRSAEASMRARSEKRGVQPPGRSGHNYGFCIDVDVEWMLDRYRWSKAELDGYMNKNGWYCHRKDHERGSESWHYNFFGPESDKYLAAARESTSTAPGLERKIQDVYGSSLALSPIETQTALKTLRLYGGAIDGDMGPLAREALMAFQRTWSLPSHGELDADTQRLLAFVTSERLA